MRAGLALAVLLLAVSGGAHEALPELDSAPRLLYELPEAGSYALPPIDRVGEYMGHSDPRTTKRYAKLSPAALEDVPRKHDR